jgi:hypothetical protein
MIFVRFRRLELSGAGGSLGSAATREQLNGILHNHFCARAKVTIFCTEVTVGKLPHPPRASWLQGTLHGLSIQPLRLNVQPAKRPNAGRVDQPAPLRMAVNEKTLVRFLYLHVWPIGL